MTLDPNVCLQDVNSPDLEILVGTFSVDIPTNPERLSFAGKFLGALEVTRFVNEVRSLARSVVLFKNLSCKIQTPGTVYVYEVIVKNVDNQVFIEEKVMTIHL